MYKLMAQKGQLIALLIGIAVIAIFLISVLTGLGSAGYSVSDDLNQIMKNNPEADFNFFNIGLQLTVILIVIGAAAGILFGIYHLITSPKGSMKFLLGFAVLIILFIILWQTSQVETSGKIVELSQRFDINDGASKLISGGLKTTVGLALGAVAIMILFEIRNVFK